MRASHRWMSRAATCSALPFEPMALITLDKLQKSLTSTAVAPVLSKPSRHPPASERAASRRERAVAPKAAAAALRVAPAAAEAASWSSKQSAADWFHQGLPFFVSPKHDGIRLVTFTPPVRSASLPTAAAHQRASRARKKTGGCRPSSTKRADATCFSRHGRPIYGLSWIESELALLRTLANDPALALDGELYLHKETCAKAPRGRPPTRRHESGKDTGAGAAMKGGFLAVNALATRLRAASSQCTTIDDVLEHVNALPTMCAFDVIAYTPSLAGSQKTSSKNAMCGADWLGECHRIRQEAMEAHNLRSLECLQCIPNITPFSLRVRALFFLADLLERGLRSPILSEHFGLVVSSQSAEAKAAAAAAVGQLATYKGGRYVKAVPYALSHSLAAVEKQVLPEYTARGYEGVVLRTPNNLYELREKQKGIVQMFVQPLQEQARASLQRHGRKHDGGVTGVAAPDRRRVPRQLLTCHRFCLEEAARSSTCGAGKASQVIFRTYTDANSTSQNGLRTGKGHRVSLAVDDVRLDVVDPRVQEESEALDTLAMVERAVRRAKTLPPRSFTVAKVLPFRDQEYAVLRPLLKAPSTNPRTRQLASIQTGQGKRVCYGLQCLAENGRVFNVSLPKMAMQGQKDLLKHLSSVTKKKSKSEGLSGLTGLYVTVKYGALTEHGVPRFGTVKAIRGGKGWFL